MSEQSAATAEGTRKITISESEEAIVCIGQLNFQNGNNYQLIFQNFLAFARQHNVSPDLIVLNGAGNDRSYIWGNNTGLGLILDKLEESDSINHANCMMEVEGWMIYQYRGWNKAVVLQKLGIAG